MVGDRKWEPEETSIQRKELCKEGLIHLNLSKRFTHSGPDYVEDDIGRNQECV